jgi:hypothetical protein
LFETFSAWTVLTILMLIDNFTLSIDLSSSWTNETVAINLIAKDPSMSILNDELLWNTDNKSFYSWAGDKSGLVTSGPPVDQLWRFVGTADGGGVWSQVTLSSSVFVKTFRRSFGSGVAIGDTGYYVGGQSYSGYTGTDPDFPSAARTPQIGVVSFNSTSKTFITDLSGGLNDLGTVRFESVVAIPAFGLDGRGLLFVLGGEDPGLDTNGANSLCTFDNITMYDPYIKRWFAQTASGTVPTPREEFCAVAQQGDNGTYEM